MGFMDDIGDAWDAVGDAGGESLGTVIDIAKAYHGVIDAETSGNRGRVIRESQAATGTIAASIQKRRADYFAEHKTMHAAVNATEGLVSGTVEGLNYGVDKVKRGMSTYQILASGTLPGTDTGLVGLAKDSPSDWRKAWGLSDNVTPGQATLRGFADAGKQGPSDPHDSVVAALGLGGSTWENLHHYGERGDDKFSPKFSWGSGTIDAAITMSRLDPLVGVGKATKAVRAVQTELHSGDLAAMAATDVTGWGKRAQKTHNQFKTFLSATDDKTPAELMKTKPFAESSQGAALASLFSNASGDHEAKALIWRTAMGDPEAKKSLVAKRADLSFQIDRMQSDLDDLVTAKYAPPIPGHYGLRTPAAAPDPDAIKALEAEIKSSTRTMDFLDRAVGDEKAQALSHEMRTPLNKDEAGVFGSVNTRARISKFDERRSSRAASYTVQDGVGGMPVRIMRSPTQRRPQGWIDLHDAEQGFQEIDRMTQRVRGLDPALRQDMLDKFLNAKDDASRGLSVRATENKVFAHIGAQLGYTPKEVETLLTKTRTEQDSAMGRFRQSAYGTLEDGTTVRSPLMETQLANSIPTLDVDHVYRVLKRNRDLSAAARRGHAAWDTSEAFLDTMNDLWKTSVLLRGGYALRNVMDSNLRLIAHMGALHAMTRQAESAGKTLRHKLTGGEAEQYGQGELAVGPYKPGDAFGKTQTESDLHHKQVSSSDDWASLAAGESERILNNLRGSGSWVTVAGDDPLYTESYLRVVNQHLRQSEISQRLIAGESPDSVVRWLKSPEGRVLRRRLVHGADSPEDLVDANLQNLNHLVPDPAMRAILKDRAFTEGDVDTMFPNEVNRPGVNAEQVQWSLGQGKVARAYQQLRTNWFQWANGLPDDVLGRHPMYVTLYRGKMRELLERSDPTLEGTLSAADQAALEVGARSFARREMKRYMFDASNKSNLGHFLRFVSPFYSAWEDVLIKYGRMIANDPALIAQGWKVWTAPNNSSLVEVVDSQTGKPIAAKDSRLNDNESIRLPAPFLKKYFSTGGVDISKASFNVVLQGDPVYLPGAGPIAQAPVNELALHLDNPTVSEAAAQLGILPYGVQNQSPARFFFPTVVKNATIGEAQGVRMKAMIAVTEETRYAQGERKTRPTAAEINAKYRALVALRTFTSAVSPVAVQYKSPYQYYIDQSHAYDAKYGNKADEKFYKDFGEDLFLFRTSMSNNRTGIMASRQADTTAKRLKSLIEAHPDYGWYFVGPDNKGDYDPNAYTAQSRRKVNPLSSDTWRDTYSNPLEALAKTRAQEGWIEYQKLTSRLEAIRIQRGLPNMQVKGAADLRAAKAAWMAGIQGKDAPAWGHDWLNDYEARDAGSTRKFLEAARAATLDDRIKSRPDIATMAEYLKYRDAMRGILAQRKRAGGSGTLTGNDDVAAAWAAITGYLVDKNLTFADTFSRYLERDDLSGKA